MQVLYAVSARMVKKLIVLVVCFVNLCVFLCIYVCVSVRVCVCVCVCSFCFIADHLAHLTLHKYVSTYLPTDLIICWYLAADLLQCCWFGGGWLLNDDDDEDDDDGDTNFSELDEIWTYNAFRVQIRLESISLSNMLQTLAFLGLAVWNIVY